MLDLSEPVDRTDHALVQLMRAMNDPRLIGRLASTSEVDLQRGGLVIMARIRELHGAELTELAAAAGLDVAATSRHLARLIAHGMVRRIPHAGDRRAMRHELTAEGEVALDGLRQARHRMLQSVLDEFDPEERATFAALFARFAQAVSEAF